jgi:hypothetical protein
MRLGNTKKDGISDFMLSPGTHLSNFWAAHQIGQRADRSESTFTMTIDFKKKPLFRVPAWKLDRGRVPPGRVRPTFSLFFIQL